MTAKRTTLLIGVAIFAIVTATFAVNLRNDLIRYDDFTYIVQNEATFRGLNRPAVVWAFLARGYASNWHPLAWISHAADVSLARLLGLDYRERENRKQMYIRHTGSFPVLVHAVNILIHAANAVLLFWLILVLSGSRDTSPVLAAFFALLWALHPLRVEVVAWAAERKELLCVFFLLLAFLAHVRGRGGWSAAAFVAALLAKPVAVSFPALVFAYDWAVARRPLRESLARVFPLCCFSAATAYLTMVSQTTALETGREFSLLQRSLAALEAPAVYLVQTVLPVGLSPDYPMPDASSWPWAVAGGLILAAMAAVVVLVFVRPGFWSGLGALAIAWMYVGLVPMLGIVKVGYEPHNDRYTYWIGCGAAVCACAAAVRLGRFWRGRERTLVRIGAALLLVLAGLSVRQCLYWKDTISLFGRITRLTGSESFALSYAELMACEDRSRVGEAEEALRDVLDRRHTPEARAALAVFLAQFGRQSAELAGVSKADSSLPEAKLLADISLGETPVATLWAEAALGYVAYRDRKFKVAYAHMKEAMDRGYACGTGFVDLEEWKAKAKEEEKGERK